MTWLRTVWFRLLCLLLRRRISIGRGLRLKCWLELDGPGSFVIGDHCTIDSMPGGRREHVTLYSNSPASRVVIGNGVLLRACRLSCKYLISIGNEVLIEDAGLADTDFHSIDPSRADAQEDPEQCRIVVGDRVAIGSRSVICKGVTLGEGARIIAGSVVRKSVPAGITVLGNPARPVPAGG